MRVQGGSGVVHMYGRGEWMPDFASMYSPAPVPEFAWETSRPPSFAGTHGGLGSLAGQKASPCAVEPGGHAGTAKPSRPRPAGYRVPDTLSQFESIYLPGYQNNCQDPHLYVVSRIPNQLLLYRA
jgi:hypothetical protein